MTAGELSRKLSAYPENAPVFIQDVGDDLEAVCDVSLAFGELKHGSYGTIIVYHGKKEPVALIQVR